MVMCIFTLYFVLFQVLLWRQEAAELPYTEEAAVEHGNANRSQGCFFSFGPRVQTFYVHHVGVNASR